MNASLKSSLPVLSAFGMATAAGLVAALLWKPNAGLATRRRLADRFRNWMQLATGPKNHRHHVVPTASRPSGSDANLGMDPEHLIDRP